METIQMPALGRLFRLGMFYDSSRDQLLSDKIVWHHDEINDYILVQPKPESEYTFTAEDTISEKTSFLDINADLKLSFMCGLVNVQGAAKYLEDRKQFTQQSRVSFKYRCTTHFEELMLDSLLRKSTKRFLNFDKDKATHIVVGILYGMESIFLFDKTYSDDKDVKEINISLEAQVACLTKMSFETGCTTEETHAVVGDVRCTYYGDLTLDKNPTTFKEAVNVFKTLPSRIDHNGQATVPLSVWLYPLSNLSPRAPKTHKKVNMVMINEIEEQFENLAIQRMKCNDLLAKLTCTYFDDFKQEIKRLKKDISDSEKELAENLSNTVPDVRQSLLGNSQIRDIVEENKGSADKIDLLYSFYNQKGKTLTAIINKLQKVSRCLLLRSDQSELYDRKEPIINVQMPDSFDKPENVFKKMQQLINNTVAPLLKNVDLSSQNITLEMTVSSEYNEIEVLVENMGTDVAIPDAPGKPYKVTSSAYSIDISCNPPGTDIERIADYIVSFTTVDKQEWQSREFKNLKKPQFSIDNLRAGTCYIFRTKCIPRTAIDVHKGVYSKTSDPIFTKPSLGSVIVKDAEIITRGSPSVIRFPLKRDVQNDHERITRYSSDYHCAGGNLFEERVILILGNNNSKITEILDGIINYIVGVDLPDSYRCSFGHIEKNGYIEIIRLLHTVGVRIDYTLTIIDFSDIINYDKSDVQLQIQQQLGKLFKSSNGCTRVHGIIIAIPADLDKVERSQYKFNHEEAVSMLGSGIKKNIIYLTAGDEINYDDEDANPVTFQFKTSILFTDKKDSVQQKNWIELLENFKTFFQRIEKLDPKLLNLDSVVTDIQSSEFLISDLQSKIQVSLSELSASRQEFQTLEAHKEDISANKPFSYEVTEIRIRHEYRKDKQPSTYCLSCKVVCHEKCAIVIDSEKSGCEVMDKSGNCTKCRNYCTWKYHINPGYRSILEIVKVIKNSTISLTKLDMLKDEITSKQGLTVSDIKMTTDEINKIREDSNSHDEKISVQYFIDHMITVEEHEQYPWYEERIEELKLLREHPDIMVKKEHQD